MDSSLLNQLIRHDEKPCLAMKGCVTYGEWNPILSNPKINGMEKQLTVTIPNVSGEDGLTIACREGKLFRDEARLVDLYKDGFRIYNYTVLKDDHPDKKVQTRVKVFLKK